MKLVLTLLLLLILNSANAQCFELLTNKLDSIQSKPYALVKKLEYQIESGKTLIVFLQNVEYRTKFTFLIQQSGLNDTLSVSLLTINRQVLNKKVLTREDPILRCNTLKKSGDYFLLITTKERVDEFNKPLWGCLGIVVLERRTSTRFRRLHSLKWVK